MTNLLYKEFKLVIHPLYHLIPLFGALVLIPTWVYFVALMYFLFIAIPNIFVNAKAQNDTGFSVLLPVRKNDVVKARVLSMATLEVIQVAVAAVFVAISLTYYRQGNFFIDANIAYLGCALVMYGVFNLVFFPLFYRTAHKVGVPLMIALVASFLFSTIIELLVVLSPAAANVLDGRTPDALMRQIPVLAAGMAVFAFLTWLGFHFSAKNFEKVDL